MDSEELGLRLGELVKEANAILEHAEQAATEASRGNLQNAVDLIAMSHTKVSSYDFCRRSFLEAMANEGLTPGG